MRLATIEWDGSTSAALVMDGGLAPVRALPSREDAEDVRALIARPLEPSERDALAGRVQPLEGSRLLPPILRPPKNVLCVGRNYMAHVEEGARAEGREAQRPEAPIWFTKSHTALVGCGGEVRCDPAFTDQLDYEGELAVVIGRGGYGIPAAEALSHVFGYTGFLDITARDRQRRHGQWFKGKSADTYGPCGPWVVTADEIEDPQRLTIETIVDGDIRQSDTTANMLFDVATLVADISEALTLEPGDLIATGTPEGVAWGRGDSSYLVPGSVVELRIEGIGRLWNTVSRAGRGKQVR
jgi:2-keto-4-pentenoate hydratase/2-oxohepta-3-ene-1,7-dioic acid hydratase in catechol pathway